MATSGERQVQRIKTTYLKHKTPHKPIVCTSIMEHELATTGGAAEEARADDESGTESESDGAPDYQTSSALGILPKSEQQEAESLESGFQKVWFRQD